MSSALELSHGTTAELTGRETVAPRFFRRWIRCRRRCASRPRTSPPLDDSTTHSGSSPMRSIGCSVIRDLRRRVELISRFVLGRWGELRADGFCDCGWCVAHREVVALRDLDLFEVVECFCPLCLEAEVVVARAEDRHGRQ